MNISNSAYLLHAAINPFIYSIVDKKFRSILSNLFCKKFKKCKTYSHHDNGKVESAM